MSFDGNFQTERAEFDSIEKAWEYSNDLGSKWYFYPFHFVVTESKKTVVATPEPLEGFTGMRVKAMARIFEVLSNNPATKGMDAEAYCFELMAA